MIVFILTSWRDLSQPGTNKKYYTIGSIPLFVTNLVPVFLSTYIVQIPASAVFSVASFFLFLAFLPLMYAPETLPEKKSSGLGNCRVMQKERRKLEKNI